MDYVDFEDDATYNEISDQGGLNKTTNSERSSINDNSKTVPNKILRLRISMKKLIH